MQPYIFHSGRPMMQPVLLNAGGSAPAFTNTVRPPLAAAVMRPEPHLQMQPPPTSRSQPVGLYLCSATHTATGTHSKPQTLLGGERREGWKGLGNNLAQKCLGGISQFFKLPHNWSGTIPIFNISIFYSHIGTVIELRRYQFTCTLLLLYQCMYIES